MAVEFPVEPVPGSTFDGMREVAQRLLELGHRVGAIVGRSFRPTEATSSIMYAEEEGKAADGTQGAAAGSTEGSGPTLIDKVHAANEASKAAAKERDSQGHR